MPMAVCVLMRLRAKCRCAPAFFRFNPPHKTIDRPLFSGYSFLADDFRESPHRLRCEVLAAGRGRTSRSVTGPAPKQTGMVNGHRAIRRSDRI